MDPMTVTEVITTAQLAARWNTTQEALRWKRKRGTGPEWVILGNSAVYLVASVEAWEETYGPNGRPPRRDSKRYAQTLEASA